MRRLICLSLVVLTAFAASGRSGSAQDLVWLTLLHNNDGESKLLNAGAGPLADYGGVARYKTLIDFLKAEASAAPTEAQRRNRIVLNISSGDNFLVGPQFAASLAKGPPYYDAIAMSHIGYDAAAIGNHEFDYGPNTLGEFIGSFFPPVPFLSANLNVEPEAALQAKVATGQIAPFVVVEKRGQRFGIIGATTPRLPFISSPRNVELDENVAGAVQAAINALQSEGVNRIILSSHLQTVTEDLALIPRLPGVDIAIAGGGDELLANAGDLLVPGDTTQRTYPIMVRGADGNEVPVVTTAGDYKYIGRLVVAFDPSGRIVEIDEEKSGPVRVSGVGLDAVTPDPEVQAQVVEPVAAFVAELANRRIGTAEVAVDGRRDSVRSTEANGGDLLADALPWEARRLAPNFAAPQPLIALQNGGGIRNNSLIPAGPFSELHTHDIAPFANFVSIVREVSPQQLKEILENAVSAVEAGDGRFAQIAGFRFTWSASGTPQTVSSAGQVTTPGSRVREVMLDNGTVLVSGGAVVAGAPSIPVATIDFLAGGGDQYPFRGSPYITLGVTYQQALSDFITSPLGLNGTIRAADYPLSGEGRITRID